MPTVSCRVAIPVAIVCTALRYALSVSTRSCAEKDCTGSKFNSSREAIVEECWLLLSSSSLLALSTWATGSHNNGCRLLGTTSACFEGWPVQENSREMALVMAVFLGWYLHCLLKNLVPAFGGQRAGAELRLNPQHALFFPELPVHVFSSPTVSTLEWQVTGYRAWRAQ